MTLKQIFGKNIKYFRFQKKLTQEKFAELVDLNTSYISELEHGKYGPTFEKIEQIAEVLNVQPYMLFQETNHTHNHLPMRVDMKSCF